MNYSNPLSIFYFRVSSIRDFIRVMRNTFVLIACALLVFGVYGAYAGNSYGLFSLGIAFALLLSSVYFHVFKRSLDYTMSDAVRRCS